MKIILFVVVKAVLLNVGAAQIVNTTYGAVRGTTLLSRNGNEITSFLGIPYANALGELRFKSPQPPEKWAGVRDAHSYGPICSQHSTTSETNSAGDEDCLTINVHVPSEVLNNNGTELLPVLVFIHGGFFMMLSASQYGPRYLLDHPIIFVSFNYRLGVLGFLGIPDGDEDNAPGNAGLKDQAFALKWVQENIRNFKGDPERVTIYGESAGSASIHYQLLSPMSKGLFSAAISGSGTAFKLNSHQISPVEAAEKLANLVGCGDHVDNHTEMIACLRMINASALAAVTDEYSQILKDPLRMLAPITEPGNSMNAFITQDPFKILVDGLQQAVPWMVGVNSGEGFISTIGIYASEEWTNEINNNWMNGLASKFLLYNESDTELTRSITEFYLNASETNGSVDFQKDFFGFTNIFSDRLYIHASLEAARIQSNLSPVYLYYNDYITTANPVGYGTMHGEELALIFSPGNLTDAIIDQGHPDYEQSNIMVDLWVQFITNPHNVSYNEQRWNPMEPLEERPTCLVFRNANRGEQSVDKLPEDIVNRINFWRRQGVPPYQEHYL